MLVYDGDCAFCTRCAHWVEDRLPHGRYEVVPWQDVPDLARYGLTEDDVTTAAYWIDRDGRAHRGHRSIARSLMAIGGAWRLLGWLLLVPPISWLAAGVYVLIARNRHRMPGGSPACKVDQ